MFTASRPIHDESYSISALRSSDGTPVWQRFLGQDVGPWDQPLVVGSVVITTSGGEMVALDTGMGTTRWKLDVGEDALLTANGDSVLANGKDGLVSVDAATGELQWKVDTDGFVAERSMDVTDAGTVVIADSAKGVMGIDADTGQLLWTDAWPEGAESPYVVQVRADLTIVADWTDIGETEGHITGLDTATGSTLWRHPVSDASSRYLAGGDVVMDVSERLVIARSPLTGGELWRFEGFGFGAVSVPDDGLVVIHDRGKFRGPGKPDTSTVHLLDVDTGAVEWST